MFKPGRLIILSAPSGAGKGTVLREVLRLRPETRCSVSATTRPPRAHERNGEAYHFVTEEAFDRMVAAGDFLEWARYINHRYGTPRAFVEDCIRAGSDVLLEIELDGARIVREKLPQTLSIFLAPPSWMELERRLRGRGTDSETELQARLERARVELAAEGEYDHVVVNGDPGEAAREIVSILNAEN